MENISTEKIIDYIFDYTATQELFLQQQEQKLQEQQQLLQGQKATLQRLVGFLQVIAMRKSSESNAEAVEKIIQQNDCGIDLQFTEKEINSMPKTFKKEFRTDGCTAHIRKRQTSKHGYTYDIRYRRNGYNICVTGKNLETTKQRFIEKLKTAEKANLLQAPTGFCDFATNFFDSFYCEKVVERTCRNTLNIFVRWIKPHFENADIRKITPTDCKHLLDSIKAKGYGKTADDVRSILNQIFKMAIAYNLIRTNPVAVIPHKQHTRTNGKRLTVAEQQKLLAECKTEYRQIYAIYLYAGIRPGEIYTVRIDGKFIVCQNSKQKDHEYREKRIPIMTALQPYLQTPLVTAPMQERLRIEFKRILPEHTLKDCRRTFSSHCKECGVNSDLLEYWLGHSKGAMHNAYTEFSDTFALSEAAKVC